MNPSAPLPFTFDDARHAIRITRPDLPTPWIHYLSNDRLHAMISQASGGFAWYRSPVAKRLTRYRQFNLPLDSPGFYLWIREADGSVWSPAWRPATTPVEGFCAEFRPGFATFQASHGALTAELTLWVAPDDVLVWELNLRTSTAATVEVDVFAYVEVSQPGWEGESGWGYYTRHQQEVRFDEAFGGPVYLAHTTHPQILELPLLGLASDVAPTSWDGDRDLFIGPYRSEALPVAVEAGHCGGHAMPTGEACLALHHHVMVPADGAVNLHHFLVVAPDALTDYPLAQARLRDLVNLYRNPDYRATQRALVTEWWADRIDRFHAATPDPSADRMANTWGAVQVLQTGRYSRAVNTLAPGIRGVGFRDTAQDMTALAPMDADWAWSGLQLLMRHQFADGHSVHYLYPEEKKPPTTSVHCDNHLWLGIAAYAIAAERGPGEWLNEPIPFLAHDLTHSDGASTLLGHLERALDWTMANLGAHGLPLIYRSDWNDIIGKFSVGGKGESVMAAMQAIVSADRTADLLDWAGQDGSKVRAIGEQLRRTIEDVAWDGEWWIRAFDDDGNPVGSRNCQFGKLWLNSQTWSVLARVGTEAQRESAMEAVYRHLVTPMGLRKLWPGFKTYPEISDPFSGYSPGCGENGAIFCHAHAWSILAEAEMGHADRAWEYWRMILPEAAMARAGLDRYQAEPYAYVSNIVGPENDKFGWANVAQVTGAAAWMHIGLTQYLLGLRPTLTGLELRPCLPADWDSVNLNRTFRGKPHRYSLRRRAEGGWQTE